MAAHFPHGDKSSGDVEGNSPKEVKVTGDVDVESSQSDLGLASSGDATDDEVDSVDSGYSQCRSANFSSSRSWYHSPDNNDFMFGSADFHGFLNDSGGSGDAFVDALDEYFDTDTSAFLHHTGGVVRGTGLYEDGLEEKEDDVPSTLHANGVRELDDEAGGVEEHGIDTGKPLHAEGRDDSHSDCVPEIGPLLEDESCSESTMGDDGADAYLQIGKAGGNNGKENDEAGNRSDTVEDEKVGVFLCVDKHPLEPSDFESHPEEAGRAAAECMQVQGHESEVLALRQDEQKPPEDIGELKVTENMADTKEVTVARTAERKKCIMRLGSKEAEDLLQLDVAEIVKPLRLSPLKKADRPTDWSREHLGPDELSRYVETLDVRETYMDTLWDMEEILLDSGETSGGHSFWATKGSGTPTRTTSPPASVYDGLWKVDSVEVVGARQRRGGASLGERVVGIREHTIYRIRVKSGRNEWEIERRYRDFVELFQQLKRMFNASRVQLPSPWEKVTVESRKIFGNTSPEVVEVRSALLQVCLQSTLQAGVPMSTAAPLLRFLFPSPGESRLPMLTSSSQFLLGTSSNERENMQLKELGSPCGSPEKHDSVGSSTPFGTTIRLILQIQTKKPLKQQLVNQRNLCAGCYEQLTSPGSLVSGFVQTFGLGKARFCEYTGQLFCAGCHLNEMAILPARVLRSWDFTPKPVSQLAKAYLDSIYDQPMLCVSAVNPFLYLRVPILAHVNEMRRKLNQLMNCIRCPSRGRIQQVLGTRRYLLEQNDFYALRDLADLSKGAFAVLPELLKATVEKLSVHVTRKCSICMELAEPCGAGNICQRSSDLIYPFQDDGVHRCQLCSTPYHKNCFKVIETCRVCNRDVEAVSSTHQFSDDDPSSLSTVLVEDQDRKQPRRSFFSTLFGSKNTQQARRNSSILNLLGPVEL